MILESQRPGDFPTAPCGGCGRVVLAYVDFDGGARRLRCLHCDARLDDEAAEGSSLSALEDAGYGFLDADEKKGGCATTGACSLTGREVSGPGQGGCHGGDCTQAHGPLPVLG